jgi:hypothetical protein
MTRALTIAIAVLVLLGSLAVFGFINDPFGWRKHQVATLQTKADTATAEAKAATGQVEAGKAVAPVIQQTRAKETAARTTHEENTRRIQTAPGADTVLDPGYVDAVNRGLCGYDVTPLCGSGDQLPGSDPGRLQDAGAGRPAAAARRNGR